MQRRYDRQIIIQRGTPSQSASGAEETITWADLAFKCFAHVSPTKGTERQAIEGSEGQVVARGEVTFVTRFHNIPSASRPLGPEDRIIYPVDGLSANEQSPPTNRIHDIISADEVGREVDLSIKTLRRADVTT